MYATGTSTRKVQRVAEKMGVSRLSKDQVSAIASSLDADIEELCGRPLGGSPVPYAWLDATYVKCRREGRVASTAVVTAIGCDAVGWRRVLGVDVVDTESYDSWLTFLRTIRARGRGPRRCSRRRSPTPLPTSTSRRPTGSAYAPTTCRKGRTGR